MKAASHLFPSLSPDASTRPTLVIIPGGPCFSSATWTPIGTLNESFDILKIDPPGTGAAPKPNEYSFDAIVESIISELVTLTKPLVLLGHSFGALYAGACLSKMDTSAMAGFVSVAGPLSMHAYSFVGPHIARSVSASIVKAQSEFAASPSEDRWKHCLREWASLYFSDPFLEAGTKLLLDDVSDFRVFQSVTLANAFESTRGNSALESLKGFPNRKILIAGSNDKVIPAEALEHDARAIHGVVEVIPDASHWCFYEKPSAFSQIILKHFG
jgi:pimeloyl-ACP methyl ester carboxylesterase